MTVHLCRSHGSNYVILDREPVHLAYTVDGLGNLKRCPMPEKCETVRILSLEDTQNHFVKQVNFLITQCASNVFRMAQHLGFTLHEGTACFWEFIGIIEHCFAHQIEELNLSRLNLDVLPIHIGFFKKVKRLDLSHNNLKLLPLELAALPDLKVLDLTGNPLLELPVWLTEMRNLTIIRRDQQFNDKENWAQSLLYDRTESSDES